MKNCPINQNILDQINKKLNIVGYLKLHDEDFGILKKEFEEEIYHDLLNRLEIFYVLELTDVNVFYRENLREICEIAKKNYMAYFDYS